MNIEKKKQFIINTTYFAIIALLIVFCFKYLLPFLIPFLIGFIIAYVLRRPTKFLNKKCKINFKVSAIICVVLFYLTAGVLLFILGFWALHGIESLLYELPGLYTRYAKEVILSITQYIENFILNIGENEEFISALDAGSKQLISYATSAISKISVSLVSWGSGVVTSVPGLFLKTVLMIISTFFSALDFDKIIAFLKKQIGNKASTLIKEIKSYVFGTVLVCLKSYAIIMTLTFVELSLGLTIIGIDNAIIIALLISVLDILPVLGTGAVIIPWAIISFIIGNIGTGIGLILLYICITVVRNIVEPKIVGGQLGLHPLVTLVSMFMGVNIAGIIGLFGFPILLSLLVHLNNHGVINIIKK